MAWPWLWQPHRATYPGYGDPTLDDYYYYTKDDLFEAGEKPISYSPTGGVDRGSGYNQILGTYKKVSTHSNILDLEYLDNDALITKEYIEDITRTLWRTDYYFPSISDFIHHEDIKKLRKYWYETWMYIIFSGDDPYYIDNSDDYLPDKAEFHSIKLFDLKEKWFQDVRIMVIFPVAHFPYPLSPYPHEIENNWFYPSLYLSNIMSFFNTLRKDVLPGNIITARACTQAYFDSTYKSTMDEFDTYLRNTYNYETFNTYHERNINRTHENTDNFIRFLFSLKTNIEYWRSVGWTFE